MNILLLGSSGFIGRNFKEYMSRFGPYKLYTPSSSQLNLLHESELEDYLKQLRPDVVVHAAVCRNPKYFPMAAPLSELEQDLRMFYNLEKYSDFYGKMIYFGSGAEYDKTRDIRSVTEDDNKNGVPETSYGLAKYIVGKTIEESRNIYNMRVFGLFGKYENWRTTFISGACCKALKGLPITIRQNTYFDYLDIDDFCPAIKWFIDETPKYHTYNVCSGRKIDLLTIAEKVRRLSGNDVPIYVCQPGLAKEYTADNGRLREECTDFSLTDFDESIQRLLVYYQGIDQEIDMLSLLY